MNDDMLSQEEINELLKGVGIEEDDEPTSEEEEMNSSDTLRIEDYLSPFEQDALGEIGNISFGSAATALSTLLNQKVEITTPQVTVINRSSLDKEFPQPHVAVSVQYTEGFEGMNLLVIKSTDAAIIADLMLGGDGLSASTDLSEMQISAVQEAMNQMMGSASTSMSTIFNKRVDISPPGIELMNVPEEKGIESIPTDEILVKISFRLKIGNLVDSSIMQLLTVSFAKQLVDELMNPPVPEPVQVELEQQQVTQSAHEPAVQEPVQPMPQQQPATVQHKQPISQTMDNQPVAPYEQPQYEQRGQQYLGTQFQQRQVDVQPAAFSTFEPPSLSQNEVSNLNMLLDIPLHVTVELGRTKRSIKEILEFGQGSIIELDKLAGEPVDILVNQKLIAKGEVVVIDENFGVRVTDIVSQQERIKNLR
ncbi:flagellar motor switch phosphatase FliY [Alkalihalobacterium alkalinitrilicum]|uniref:flagellar motor switch phosphatase FliY n=1 Tax=Alkalihalobacterium alkalinitrilicum TaxID=427920 RepID=UPI000994FB7A|nr:flagellar motor switch phosphatase FliY [Alkalihalobacterium alkalinitrilicum]